MKKIYIVLTHTGTLLSKIIKKFTKDEFSHSSISLDIKLEEMYSFGRLNPYNAIFAGFVHEYINKGTFKRFYKTKAKIYSLEITEEQYEKIKTIVKQMEENPKIYKFNILGLIAAGFHIKIKIKNYFYCAEFMKYIIEEAGIKLQLPEIAKPEDFKKIEQLKQIYSGFLKNYEPIVKEEIYE